MCITASNRDHQVMSSGDTAVVPTSITNSDTNKLPHSDVAEAVEQDNINSSSSLDLDKTEKANLPSSVSDFDLHEQSTMPSNSDSLENMAPEVISLGAEEVGEILKRENAKSAFEITSFRPATDDLDKSGAGRPVSTDSLTLHTVMEKGESEETVVAPKKKHQLTDTQPEALPPNNNDAKLVDKETPANELLEVSSETTQGSGASSPKTVPTIPEEPASKSSASGMVAQPGNGAGVQPNRFRRVNQYDRGRWTIRDSLVTEEQAEGLSPHQQSSPSEGSTSRQSSLQSTKQQDSSDSSNGTTPPLKSAQQRSDSSTQQRSDSTTQQRSDSSTQQRSDSSTQQRSDSSTQQQSDLTTQQRSDLTTQQRSDWTTQQRSDSTTSSLDPPQLHIPTELNALLGITGGGLALDSTSDKDSSSIHMDRSSTAAETLSRNTSMSSLIAPEKSIDGDELLRDIDADSMSGITGNQNSSQDQDVNDIPLVSPQPPVVATSSSGAVPPPSSTAIPREEEQQGTPSTGSGPEDVDLRRVEHAMSFLQNELKQVLTSSSYPMLMEENRVLKDERTLMDQTNSKLRTELHSTKEDLAATREENTRLKKELKELRCSLTRLALVPEGSTEGSEGDTSSSQSVPVEDAPPAPPTSDDTSNSSQDVLT